MQTENHPIGIFDSGYGGLTILKEIVKKLPQYDYIYLGDNARTPYGTRSFDVVYEYTLEAVKTLFSMGCHLVILACNTASAKALRTIQQKDLPGIDVSRRVLGVIRPSIEEIPFTTKSRHIGVLGTIGTVMSESYPLEIEKISPDSKITCTQEACPMWVPIVENNEIDTPGAEYFVKKNLDNLISADPDIDTIILGCTHYPLLIDKIQKFLPSGIKVLEQGPIVAEKLEDYLKRHPEIEVRCTKGGNIRYLTTENKETFEKKAAFFLGKNLTAEKIHF